MPLLIVMALISIFVVMFALANAQKVVLSFILFDCESTLAFVTLMAFFCGLLVAGCYMLLMKARHYKQVKEMQKQIDALTSEKQKLQTLVTYLKEHQGQEPEKPKQQVNNNPYARDIGKATTVDLTKKIVK